MNPLPDKSASLTNLLQAWQLGDGAAFSEVFEQVYGQLKKIAAQRLRDVAGDSTLSPTELLHEAVLRIVDAPKDWKNRAHFFATMSLTIRSTLVDHARTQASEKRGGGQFQITITDSAMGEESQVADLLALDQALNGLEAIDPRGAEVLHLTYFAGLEREEIAAVLDISRATVDRELKFARAWLHTTLGYGI
jgi:RNA polymerase sigma factor (TIGR02999 family)